ncbi:MAG: DUF1080 domain-containing protein [Planctomycetia bacterium]
MPILHAIARLLAATPATMLVCVVAAAAWGDEPRPPEGVVRPLDEPGLAAFTTWLKATGHEDPQRVFRLEDGVLRCGDEDMGYVATRRPYRDYALRVEYRWGRKRSRPTTVRNSGVLLHGTGPHGAADGLWMTCIECQLAQGCEGDLIVIRGTTPGGGKADATIASPTRRAEDGKTRWDPRGEPTRYSGGQFWWSRHQPFFVEDYDARGRDDVASPVGEWTTVECICAGRSITISINGRVVNECHDAEPSGGHVLLQSEGDEVFFRNLELRPLPAAEGPRAPSPRSVP